MNHKYVIIGMSLGLAINFLGPIQFFVAIACLSVLTYLYKKIISI